MLVTTRNVGSFLQNLEAVIPLLGGKIWVDVVEKPLSDVKRDVFFQGSAVCVGGENSPAYFIVCGVRCGVDYLDASNERPGTIEAKKCVQQVADFALAHDLVVMPGTVGTGF
jgi:hypothetical protein